MQKKEKKKRVKKTSRSAQPTVGKSNQKIATRDKILAAAKRVFAEYPYYAATIRMVGNAAEIDHPLVTYHFPTKADLFEAVLKDVLETYVQANTSWLEEIQDMSASRSLSLYIDRLIAFSSTHPEAMKIVALNLVQPETTENIPGYEQIQGLVTRNTATFRKFATLRSPAREIRMYSESFNNMVIMYFGASTYCASVLGMDPHGQAYRRWVKESLLFLFLPRLKQLIHGETRSPSKPRRGSGRQ